MINNKCSQGDRGFGGDVLDAIRKNDKINEHQEIMRSSKNKISSDADKIRQLCSITEINSFKKTESIRTWAKDIILECCIIDDITKSKENTIILPQTIGDRTYYTKKELYDALLKR